MVSLVVAEEEDEEEDEEVDVSILGMGGRGFS